MVIEFGAEYLLYKPCNRYRQKTPLGLTQPHTHTTSLKMSFFAPQFQRVSDLHLETPLTTPQYASFFLNVQAENLFLLVDIGHVLDAGLFQFLCRILEQNRGCRVFYVLGNHESYRTTYEHTCKLLRNFEQEAADNLGGRFKLLCRDRYNFSESIYRGFGYSSIAQRKYEVH